METHVLKYSDHPDLVIRFIEWKAVEKHYCKKIGAKMHDLYPAQSNSWYYWQDAYSELKQKSLNDKRLELLTSVMTEAQSLAEAYDRLSKFLTPKPRGRLLKDKKQGTAQKEYQRNALGEAFINNPTLIGNAKEACIQLAKDWADKSTVEAKARELEALHCQEEPLTDQQRDTLLNDVMLTHIAKLQTPTRVEGLILDTGDKALYFLWGEIKRRCVIGETITLSQKEVASIAHVSHSKGKPLTNILVKLGALAIVQKAKVGSGPRIAPIFKRLV